MAFKDRLYDVPVIGTALRVQDRYVTDAGDQFAGAIGFFGFLSLFPLLIIALSAAGFVLADASNARIAEVATTIQDAIPGFAGVLGGGGESGIGSALDTIIANRGTVGLVGLVTLLITGLRVVNSAQTATLVVFRIDLLALSGIKRKLQQVVALVLLGLLAIAGVGAASAIGVVGELALFGVMEVLAPVISFVGAFVLDVGLFLAAYKLLGTVDGPPARVLLPGAVLAGLGWALLKAFGATYVSQQVSQAGELYGALGGVIGLLLLLYLAGRLYVYGAELSAVMAVTESATTGPPAAAPAPARRAAARPAGADSRAVGAAAALGGLAGLLAVLRPWDSDA